MKIVHEHDGGIAVIFPAKAADINTIASEQVPAGSRYIIVDEVPGNPPEHWIVDWDNGTVSVSAELEQASARDAMKEKVQAERARRLALGFDYDFGNDRGVVYIRTTEADMRLWDEVTKKATAFHALGDTSMFPIYPDSQPVMITAVEWFDVLKRADEVREPIILRSFALQAMDPIPDDYEDDIYWV